MLVKRVRWQLEWRRSLRVVGRVALTASERTGWGPVLLFVDACGFHFIVT